MVLKRFDGGDLGAYQVRRYHQKEGNPEIGR